MLETLRFLAQTHCVTLLTHLSDPTESEHIEAVRDLCENIETFSLPSQRWAVLKRIAAGGLCGFPLIQAYHWHPGLADRLRELTTVSHFDIVHVEFSYLAHYVKFVSPMSHTKTVLSMHNVESIRFKRELQHTPWSSRRFALLWDYYLYPEWEQKALQKFDGILATSRTEQKWIQRHAPAAKVKLVPNGVDVEYFYMRDPPQKSQSLVFTGLMNYPPNIDAMMWFSQAIWPRLRQQHPAMTLKIVGRYPPPCIMALGKQPGVCVTGEVSDVRPYVDQALAHVVPLRFGGGTRLKILAAMAQGLPVISTRLGAEGLDVTSGENILLADNAEQFLQHVQTLIDQPTWAARLGQAGHRLVVERYDWRTCLLGLSALYKALLKHG